MTIRAIETRYAGCRFRSRLEARWAVFFDALGLEWEYEPEGFELESGRYLPDFKLPEGQRWVEVKGDTGALKPRDVERYSEFGRLAWDEGWKFTILSGAVPARPTPIGIASLGWSTLPEPDAHSGEHHPWGTYMGTSVPGDTKQRAAGFIETRWIPPATPEEVAAAMRAARSARFEWGESG